MAKTANSLQAARKKARERRIALDVDREARDQRIEDAAVTVFSLLEDRAAAEDAIVAANTAIGVSLRALQADGLTVEDAAQLVDLEVADVRRLTKLAGDDKVVEAKGATVTALHGQDGNGAERRIG